MRASLKGGHTQLFVLVMAWTQHTRPSWQVVSVAASSVPSPALPSAGVAVRGSAGPADKGHGHHLAVSWQVSELEFKCFSFRTHAPSAEYELEYELRFVPTMFLVQFTNKSIFDLSVGFGCLPQNPRPLASAQPQPSRGLEP